MLVNSQTFDITEVDIFSRKKQHVTKMWGRIWLFIVVFIWHIAISQSQAYNCHSELGISAKITLQRQTHNLISHYFIIMSLEVSKKTIGR